MKKQRIGLNAHLLSSSQSYRQAGVSRYIRGLVDNLPLVDGSSEFHAYVGAAHTELPGWVTHRSPDWTAEAPVGRIFWEQTALPIATKRDRLDLLHVPVNVAPIVSSGALVATVHDLTFMRFPEHFRRERRLYQTQLTRLTVKRADAVITGSGTTCNDLCELLGVPAERITVVPDGIDSALERASEKSIRQFRMEKGLPDSFFMYLGTLEPRKNLVLLLEAYAQAVHRLPSEHRLVLAGGKGWFYDDIFAAVERLGLSDRVLFPGFVPDDELSLWYSAAQVFVYPSLYEGFGLPVLEAMACGTPAIVSDTPALCEVVADTGLVVGAHDDVALAEAMVQMSQDHALRIRHAQAAVARAKLYSWKRTARETAAVYHRILGD